MGISLKSSVIHLNGVASMLTKTCLPMIHDMQENNRLRKFVHRISIDHDYASVIRQLIGLIYFRISIYIIQ